MRSIKFRKYKAFESGELELKPLTLLLGANSSGKSSILHLLLMLERLDLETTILEGNGKKR